MDGRGQYTPLPTTEPLAPEKAPEGALSKRSGSPSRKETNDQNAAADPLKFLRTAHDKDSSHFTDGPAFQGFGALLIVSNGLVIGLETDIEWKYWPVVEHTFLALFTFELLVRILSHGLCTFIHIENADFGWNLFDAAIVGLGIFDFTMEHFTGKTGSGGFATIFRLIRLLRILRIFKVLKFVKPLYILAFGCVEAVRAVFWVTLMMVFVLYICAIVLVKTVGRPEPTHQYYEFLSYRFGHIPDSMLSLFILMSSANLPDYENTEGLLQHNVALTLFLCIFVMFASFGLVALLTGVMKESMSEKNEARKQQVRAEHERLRESLATDCENLFRQLTDLDANGEANVESVKTLALPIWEMLEQIGVEMTHADLIHIIEFMDVNGTGMVHVTEFRQVVELIAEGLSPLGMQEIESRLGVCEAKMDKLQGSVEEMHQQTIDITGTMHLIMKRMNLEEDSGTCTAEPMQRSEVGF